MEQGRKKAAGIRDGVVTRYSYRGVTKSGQARWIDQYSKTITYRGKPADLMTLIDIHDQKLAQETLRQSEKKYRELADSLPQVVFETDEKGNITFANRIAFDLFGYTRADFEKGLNALQMLIPEDRERAVANIQKAVKGEKFGGTEYTALTKDSHTYPVMLYSNPIMREGKPVGLRGIMVDLTKVRGAEEALRVSEEKYRNILESMEEGYYEVDLAGNFTFLNDALCRIRGYTRDELIGMNNREYMDPETAKEVFNVYNEVYTTGKPIKGLPWKIIRRDGTESYAEVSASLIKDSQGKPIGFRGIVRDVTQRTQAEEALKASQQRLSQIIDFLPDATMVIDLDGRVIAWNRAIEKMTGVKAKDILGKGDYEYAVPFYGERRPVLIDLVGKWDREIKKKYRYVKKEGMSLVSETYDPMVKPGGFLWNKASLLYDRNGNEIGAIESIRDITDMKVAEETLRESEERYRILVEESPLAISLIGRDGRYQYLNPKFSEIFGYSLEDIPTGREWFKKAYPDQEYRREVISSWINDQKEAKVGEARPRTYTVKCKDGSEKTISFKPVTLETGEQFVICEDITEEKRVEHALRMERDRSQMYLDVAGVMFIALDAGGKVTLANQKGCEILGYDEGEIIGRSWFDHFLPKEQKEVVKDVFQQLMKGIIETIEYFENPIITKDGNLRYIAWHNALLKNEKGENIGTFSSGEDITERRRAEEERERLEAQLRQSQKMEAIGTLAGGIAHDFNNILGAIIGYSELAKMKLPEESDTIENLDQVIKAGKRAANLVKQILTVSRQHQQEKRPLQIGYIVEEALSLLRSTLPKTIEIKEKLHKGTGVINADPNQMHQVIMNLCTNAAHAMREDGGILMVELANVELDDLEAAGHLDMDAGSYLRLTVSDTGCGMRPEIVKRIFDPYFTTKDTGEGTGLGLSVAQGIVKAHGGAITVYSEPRKGTTFHVYLPIILDAEKGKKKPKDLLVPTGTERILFIDDEQVLADIGGQMLERLGYRVVTKTDSLEALELFQREPNRFDLVITDMTMPHMTGDKLAQEMIRIRSDIPIILCTGHSTQISKEKAKKIGIQLLLMKPLNNRMISETVRKVLDKK